MSVVSIRNIGSSYVRVAELTCRWAKLQSKVTEYLDAGVLAVCVVDPKEEFVIVYTPDAAPRQVGRDETLKLSSVLPGFSVKVREFFE